MPEDGLVPTGELARRPEPCVGFAQRAEDRDYTVAVMRTPVEVTD